MDRLVEETARNIVRLSNGREAVRELFPCIDGQRIPMDGAYSSDQAFQMLRLHLWRAAKHMIRVPTRGIEPITGLYLASIIEGRYASQRVEYAEGITNTPANDEAVAIAVDTFVSMGTGQVGRLEFLTASRDAMRRWGGRYIELHAFTPDGNGHLDPIYRVIDDMRELMIQGGLVARLKARRKPERYERRARMRDVYEELGLARN